MINMEKTGRQIATLRKEKGLTGEKLAEMLGVSAQAVSKWENGKCMPETALLPDLAKTLGISVDSLIMPKELLILEAIYTDGKTGTDVTQSVNNLINGNKLDIYVNRNFLGVSNDSGCIELLTIKYQTPNGIFYTYCLEKNRLYIDLSTEYEVNDTVEVSGFRLVGAFYGNSEKHVSAMQKMKHYEYFKWDRIHVNHETFPSDTGSDETEYLSLVYLNKNGINVISCAEGQTLYYNGDRNALFLKDVTRCVLPGIIKLNWEEGMDCPWAGSLYAALKYMGDDYTYEQIMGLSGACYRICFTDVWDWSCTDALVSYNYSSVLFKALGYEEIWADRLEKSERKAERESIIRDIQNRKPVLAINLRIAPEWGVITGYTEDGNEFLCRTYFDKSIFDSPDYRENEETGGYLVNDFWPFLIVHFGDKKEKPSSYENLMASLGTFYDSFNSPQNRGYYQGEEAYNAWIKGLSNEAAFTDNGDCDGVSRRLGVNDSMLMCLIDARRCAYIYLRESVSLLCEDKRPILEKIADNFEAVYKMFSDFRASVRFSCNEDIAYNMTEAKGVSTMEFRTEQIGLLENAILLERENAELVKQLLNC